MILAGLRRLAKTVEQEARKMPITASILEHDVLGPLFKKVLLEGRQEGVREGMLTILSRMITKRFGALPGWAIVKLAAMPVSELEVLNERLLDAASVEELLR
jgi:hypothetical protein